MRRSTPWRFARMVNSAPGWGWKSPRTTWPVAPRAATPSAVGQVVNIGNTEEVSIRDVAERIRTKTGSQSPIVLVPYEEAFEAGFEDMPRRVPSLDKIHALIGYRPTADLDTILDRVIAAARTADGR